MTNTFSVIWAVAFALFLGGLGLPLPENPILIGGGYAIYEGVSHPINSLYLWYLAILCGDLLLFAMARWFFTHPAISDRLTRLAGKRRLQRYQTAFARIGGWTLFAARFTFGIRALAYIAAGAANYPWLRFLVVDSIAVAIQVSLFVGLGYCAGGRIDWAKATGEKIALLLGLAALVSILLSWIVSPLVRRLSDRGLSQRLYDKQSD